MRQATSSQRSLSGAQLADTSTTTRKAPLWLGSNRRTIFVASPGPVIACIRCSSVLTRLRFVATPPNRVADMRARHSDPRCIWLRACSSWCQITVCVATSGAQRAWTRGATVLGRACLKFAGAASKREFKHSRSELQYAYSSQPESCGGWYTTYRRCVASNPSSWSARTATEGRCTSCSDRKGAQA